MTDERFKELMAEHTQSQLTIAEIMEGGHFCPEMDGLLANYKQSDGDCFCDLRNHPTTKCCNKTYPKSIPYPVYWNPFNKCIQCHSCGHIYSPEPFGLTIRIGKWDVFSIGSRKVKTKPFNVGLQPAG